MQIEIRTEQFFIVRCYLSPHEDSLAYRWWIESKDASSARDDKLDFGRLLSACYEEINGNTRRKISKGRTTARWNEDQRKLNRMELTKQILINQDPQSQNPTQKIKKRGKDKWSYLFSIRSTNFFSTLESLDSPADRWQMMLEDRSEGPFWPQTAYLLLYVPF